MKISKTTINMAARRGLAITEYQYDKIGTCYEFALLEDGEAADEYAASYRLVTDGADTGLFFVDSCASSSEEWPHWIRDESHLRQLLDAMAAEVA